LIPGPARVHRFDIQALRALAVGLVVLYHVRPDVLPGGFIGVDVFFVLSGFLISRHLVDEATATGRVDLTRFWSKRARRLLPAALLVLTTVAIAAVAIIPPQDRTQYFVEILGSIFYVQNWVLVRESVDYFAADSGATALQHFWSLSVEEQFYVFWPLIVVLLVWMSRSRNGRRDAPVFLIGFTAIGLVSFAYSIAVTSSDPAAAYLVTPARAWEFAAGAIVAVAVARLRPPSSVTRAALAWLGWFTLLASAFLINDDMAFPGYIALLPVLGTVAVLVAGLTESSWGPDRIVAWRPFQMVGDWSYSIYLWHWPLVVLASSSFGLRLPWWIALAVAGASIVLAWLTFRYVETPLRFGSVALRSTARRTLVAGLIAMILVAAIPVTGLFSIRQVAVAEQQALAELETREARCYGGVALDAPAGYCDDRIDWLVPSLETIDGDLPPYALGDCRVAATDFGFSDCTTGSDRAQLRVAIIGDSHAGQWEPAVAAISEDLNWAYTMFIKGDCPWSAAPKRNSDERVAQSCLEYQERLEGELEERRPFDLIITSARMNSANGGTAQEVSEAYRGVWEPALARGAQVVVIRDIPENARATLGCLARSEAPFAECALPDDDGRRGLDGPWLASEGFSAVTRIDLDRYFCQDGFCPAVQGGVIVYRDGNHMTAVYARSLAEPLRRALLEAGIDVGEE